METGYTIVFSDKETLSALCGVNDGNLETIEEYLGAPVVIRGNEMTVVTSDDDTCVKFQTLIDRVLSEHPEKVQNSSDMIFSLISRLKTDPVTGLEHTYIQIPHGFFRIYPKTAGQAELISKLYKHPIVFCLGPAGTGKTFLAVAQALKMVLSHEVRKIVLTRPVVEAGENLGFLPGDLEQKINPYLRPLYDAMELLVSPEIVKRMEESHMIEIAPLAYMRGRSLDNAVVILDEAQNTTREQMKMFLTRLGCNVKAIITGDITQVDLPPKQESGLSHAVRILQNVPEIAIISLGNQDVVRNPLVKKIVQAYEQEKV
ncbi:PhoH family protein [Brucepastera parasyntrophica]|uniref:PhoH family protein n=1 Tax=Brucepastera parasyntrophica TaxID=2880008 RepID=UPI00210EB013|nr:PhoH family protein [Brucepastera parasyntrophica]ULQ59919.1 PhoH family protein [Brucepastera parasyntrophica]